METKNFTLYSESIKGQADASLVYNGFGCEGENKSPQLRWENAPQDTKSFAITLYDPDAPTGSGWWHWLVFNIPSSLTLIPSNAGDVTADLLPKEVIQSITDYGIYGYGGPCPPQGDKAHMYLLTLHALDTEKIDLDKQANPALVGFYINQHTIAKASLVFYHQRDKEGCTSC